MEDYVTEWIQDDLQKSIGGAFEGDYRKVLFQWQNAKTSEEKKAALKSYVDVQHFELRYVNQWYTALAKSIIDEKGE